MLNILHTRLQHYVNQKLPDVQAGFRKGRWTRDRVVNIRWIIERAREFQKNIYLCFMDYTKDLDCVDHDKLWKALRWEYQTILPVPWQACMWIKKQQLEPSTEQLFGSRTRKVDNRAVCCHPVCLTYMLSTSWEMPGWMSYRLESRQREKHQQPQICGWYHFNGRKQRGIKKCLDEGEGGKWKSWLKTKYFKK